MSNNISNFWATSWETIQSTRGSGAKRGFSATLMAATAGLWPFYFSWLRIDSILKFVEPVTNTDEEPLSVVLLQQGLHCIFSPSYRRFHGNRSNLRIVLLQRKPHIFLFLVYLSVKWSRHSRENLEAFVWKTKKTISGFSANRCSQT